MSEIAKRARGIGRRALLEGATFGGILALPGCGSIIQMDPQGWGNVLGTTYTLPRWKWTPTTADDVVTAVRRAETEQRRIRMTGSRYSFSDVAANDDWLLSPRGLTAMLAVDTCSLKSTALPDRLVRLQSGVTVNALNTALDAMGLALPNMGAFDKQTFVGAASTGTHGSGMAFGPLSSLIVSIHVVGPGGEMLQVEPCDGITDRSKFKGHLIERPNVKVALLQDDDLFNALTVSLGSLGIIYAVTLRVTSKFWLVERRTLTTWEELSKAGGVVECLVTGQPLGRIVPDPSPLGVSGCLPARHAEPDHVEINYTPYADSSGLHVAVLTQRWRTTCEPPGVGGERGRLLFRLAQEAAVVGDGLMLLPGIIPNKTAAVQRAHAAGMKTMSQRYYANRSFDVFQIGLLDDLHVYGIELAFDVLRTKELVTRNLALAKQFAREGMHHSSPPTLRFVDASAPLIGMTNGRKTVTMEFGVFTTSFGAEELLRSYEDVFVGGPFEGRPHWGLDRNHLRSEDAARALYPATWGRFKAALATMNPRGAFDGAVTDRLGISRVHRGG